MNLAPAAAAIQTTVTNRPANDVRPDTATSASDSGADQEEGSFGDILSALNPLQYVPIVGTIYRAITGDQPAPAWRLGGSVITGLLMGGPVGAVTSLVGMGLEELCHRIAESASGTGTPDATVPDAVTRGTAFAAYQKTNILIPAAGGVG
jgi:hypothetical protein